MSRCRESSGRSFGSTIVPPGESSCSKACDRRTKFSKSAIVASHGALAHERRAVDGREGHVVAADVQAALRVARLQLEGARRLGRLLEQEVGIEPDLVALHALAGRA